MRNGKGQKFHSKVADLRLKADLVGGLGELVGGGEVAVEQLPHHLLVARPRGPVQRRPPVRVPMNKRVKEDFK